MVKQNVNEDWLKLYKKGNENLLRWDRKVLDSHVDHLDIWLLCFHFSFYPLMIIMLSLFFLSSYGYYDFTFLFILLWMDEMNIC